MSEENKVVPLKIDLNAGAPAQDGEGGADALPRAPRIPFGPYKFTIVEEPTLEESKAGNSMLVFETELVEPESVFVDGARGRVAGKKFKLYAVLAPGKTQNLRAVHKQNGIPTAVDMDPETGLPVGITYKGLQFWATASSETQNQTIETENGQEPMLNPLTGKQMTSEFPKINNVIDPEK